MLVLEHGRVSERGRSAELAVAEGTFARLLALQRSTAALGDEVFAEADVGPRPRGKRD